MSMVDRTWAKSLAISGVLTLCAVIGACATAPSGDCGGSFSQCETSPSGSPPPGVPDATLSPAPTPSVPDAATGNGSLPCDVDTILLSNCRTCHGVSTQFGAPMSLVTLGDLHAPLKSDPSIPVFQRVGQRIMNETNPMPPPPNARLGGQDTSTLEAWIAKGAPPGEACSGPAAAPVPDAASASSEAAADAYGGIAAMGPADCKDYFDLQAHGAAAANDTTPYPVPSDTANNGNKYVCFYFDPPYATDVQGLWFAPILDQTKVLHHWLLYASNASPAQPAGTIQDCQAVEPGYYLIAGWAPGSPPTSFPSDVGLQMPPTTGSLMLQVHYFDLQGLGLSDRSGVRFCTAPQNTRPHTATVTFTGSEGICLPPKAQNFEVSGLCQPSQDMGDIHIVNVWPHMHKLGARMQITLTRAEAGVETIHDAPFDFNSQSTYPVDFVLHPGDTMQTNCFYNNTTDNQVHFGENTQDEMCYGFIVAWPANALVTDPSTQNAVQTLGLPFQQQTRCLDSVSILQSCNGLADYPVAQ